jgi:phosphoesterase RecJ-like protein
MNFADIQSIIDKHEKIFISSHINPDGDSLGSAYAMYKYLIGLGKDCIIVNHSPFPDIYNFLNKDNIFKEVDEETVAFIKKSDLGLILDIGDFYRLGDIAHLIEDNNIETLSIDHHAKSDNDLFTHDFINKDACSVGEILYSFLSEVDKSKISKEVLLGIYVAVLTDTGSFRHSNTTDISHKIAVHAIKKGIDIAKIYQSIYENSSVSRMKLLGNVIKKLNYDCGGELVWFALNHDMIKEVNGNNQDFDGFTDFFRGIKGVEVSLMLYDLKGKVRLSFRSKGKYKVSEIAKKMGGGGHPFAAAALVEGEFSDVKSTVLNLMSTYINSKK